MRVIENFKIDNRKDPLIKEVGHDHLIIRNGTIDLYDLEPTSSSGLVGLDIRKCALVEIQNVRITGHDLKRKYAYGLRSGYSNTPSEANTKVLISNCFIGGFGPLNAGYNLNRDCIASEGGDDLWIKDSVLDGASDGCTDCKTKNLSVARSSFKNSYRLVREWNTQGTFSNCTFDTPGDHFWFYSNLSKAILFNCTFKQPMKTSFDQSPGIIQTVTTEPLTNPWFLENKYSKLIEAQKKNIIAATEFLTALEQLT